MQKCLSQDDMVITDEEAAELTRRYYAEVTDFDTWVGDILDELKKVGLGESTIVIVWSGDHGLHIGTNNRWENLCMRFGSAGQVILDIGTNENGALVEIRDVRGRIVQSRRLHKSGEIVSMCPDQEAILCT